MRVAALLCRYAAWALLGASLGAGAAHAAPKASKAQKACEPTSTENAQKPRPAHCTRARVRYLDSGAETPAQRTRRLKQECKGLVNAGACQGYGYGHK